MSAKGSWARFRYGPSTFASGEHLLLYCTWNNTPDSTDTSTFPVFNESHTVLTRIHFVQQQPHGDRDGGCPSQASMTCMFTSRPSFRDVCDSLSGPGACGSRGPHSLTHRRVPFFTVEYDATLHGTTCVLYYRCIEVQYFRSRDGDSKTSRADRLRAVNPLLLRVGSVMLRPCRSTILYPFHCIFTVAQYCN